MQLEPSQFYQSLGLAESDGELTPLDLSFLKLPEQDLTQPYSHASSGIPVYVAEGKRTIFANKCLGSE